MQKLLNWFSQSSVQFC